MAAPELRSYKSKDASTPLYWWDATDLASAIRAREISAVEVVQAHLDRIAEMNGQINCVVSQVTDSESLAAATEADRRVASGDQLGPLHGLPTAVKDLLDVRGIRTTFGSLAFANNAPAERDSLLVSRLRDAGAIVIGKTNAPEYGVGTLAFNPVFGVTRNPYDLTRHGGGSSSAAAALASGMLPIADGSDSGGSLRYPPAFCNVVGLRTTAGRVPSDEPGSVWSPHAVLGPMARNSRDAGLMLSAIAGADIVSPLSLTEDPEGFASLPERSLSGLRIAWSADADGLPIDPEIRRVHAEARRRLEELGCVVEDTEIDFSGADEAWEILEMFGFFSLGWSGVEANPDLYSPDFVRNVGQGAQMSPKEIARGLELRTDIYRRTASLLQNYDVFVAPATPVAAPAAEEKWVHEVDGVEFDRYFRWQRLATRLTMTAHPVLVTGAGFTSDGLPVGMQLLGGMRSERNLLSIGAAIEAATGWNALRPAG